MRLSIGAAFLAFLLNAASPAGFSQLRNISEYSQDRINTDETYFVLHDTGAADFGWASEWTLGSSVDYSEKSAMFVWHFKDGSKAYAQQAEDIGEAGIAMGYLIAGKSSNLEDVRRKPIQPMTRNNFPVKVELWIGEIGGAGFSPKILIDSACVDAQSVEPNHTYYFSSCKLSAEK
jgi:hypothetical protein